MQDVEKERGGALLCSALLCSALRKRLGGRASNRVSQEGRGGSDAEKPLSAVYRRRAARATRRNGGRQLGFRAHARDSADKINPGSKRNAQP